MPIGITTGYKNSAGEDIGEKLVPKEYLIDRYPELLDNFRFAGLWLWGFNAYGQLGDNTLTVRSTPVQTVSAGANWKLVAGGHYLSTAIKTDGTLWLWGRNAYGQLGDNSRTNVSSPVQTISAGTDWKQVDTFREHTAAIKTDGTLWAWGYNLYGQLGDDLISAKSSPVQTVAGGTNWKLVSCGDNHTAAIKTDGTLWLWGRNTNGRLGTNSTTNVSSPVQTVAGGTNWKQVSAGNSHTAAIKTDGTLWAWGLNSSGQLGINSTTDRSSPVQTVSAGTNWKLVESGSYHISAIKTDGTLWLWGNNGARQLGDNTTTARSSPVQTVAGGTNWKQVSSGRVNTAAIKTDGTLWLWGSGTQGQLGQGLVTSRSSPVQTVSAGNNWKQVSVGGFHIEAIRDDSNDYL